MSEKIIIDNQTNLKMANILSYVQHVIKEGKISKTSKGKQYCFHTSFPNGIEVSVFKNDKSERFIIWR